MIAALCEHLWQSTLFAGGIWLLTLVLRNHRARLRHWLWLAASIKFLVPFALLTMLGTAIELDHSAPVHEALASAITIFAPLSASGSAVDLTQASAVNVWTVLVCCWIVGSIVLSLRWLSAWLQTQAVLRTAMPLDFDAPIPVKASPQQVEPSVVGVLHPIMLLPIGIADSFSSEQLRAIVAHELCHVERRDNLKAAVHMLVEVLLWFHPLVWWIGGRLLEERERACDEAVLDAGHAPSRYAEGVLNVCRLFHGCPLIGVAASGGDLKKRIECILSECRPTELTRAQEKMLGVLALLIIAAPIAAGAMTTGRLESAAPSAPMETLLLSVSRGSGADGAREFHVIRGTLRDLIALAYGVDGSHVRVSKPWLDSQIYRFETTSSDDPGVYQARLAQVLAERFNLQIYVNGRCQHPCGRSEQASSAALLAPLWSEHYRPASISF